MELPSLENANNVSIGSNRMSFPVRKNLLFNLEKGLSLFTRGLFSFPNNSLTFKLFSFLEIMLILRKGTSKLKSEY